MSQEIHIDTLFSVMEFLSMEDGISLLCVCKSWYELDRFEIVWKTLLSNYILTKIHVYRKLTDSDGGDGQKITKKKLAFYKSILDNLTKFHQSQIVKEKSVNKASFEKYMEDVDGNESEIGEKSSVFGMRFKKLASSAIIMHYNLIMSKGLEEMRETFTNSIVKYEHKGYFASHFLSESKKFTQEGRVNNTTSAKEYWNKFSILLTEMVFKHMSGNHLGENQIISFFNNFKPILNDRLIETFFSSYWNTMENQNEVGKLFEFILSYASKEENYEKSKDSFIDIGVVNSVLSLKYLKQLYNMIYPNQWHTNLEKNITHHKKYILNFFRANSYETTEEVVDNLCQFLEIVEETSIDFLKVQNLFKYKNEKETIDLLGERGLITANDYKIIFHKIGYESKISHLLPIIGTIDPYEIIQTENGRINFVSSYFSIYSHGSIYQFFHPFFEAYPEKFDLQKLIDNGLDKSMQTLRELINYRVHSHFIDYYAIDDIVESVEIMNNCFTPSLDVSCIEKIVSHFEPFFIGSTAYKSLTNQNIFNGFQYAIRHICYEGIPFEEYCQNIRHKYSTDAINFNDCEGEERMAYLYNLCLIIIEEMPKYFGV